MDKDSYRTLVVGSLESYKESLVPDESVSQTKGWRWEQDPILGKKLGLIKSLSWILSQLSSLCAKILKQNELSVGHQRGRICLLGGL